MFLLFRHFLDLRKAYDNLLVSAYSSLRVGKVLGKLQKLQGRLWQVRRTVTLQKTRAMRDKVEIEVYCMRLEVSPLGKEL